MLILLRVPDRIRLLRSHASMVEVPMLRYEGRTGSDLEDLHAREGESSVRTPLR